MKKKWTRRQIEKIMKFQSLLIFTRCLMEGHRYEEDKDKCMYCFEVKEPVSFVGKGLTDLIAESDKSENKYHLTRANYEQNNKENT
jgi:hypothetical protein